MYLSARLSIIVTMALLVAGVSQVGIAAEAASDRPIPAATAVAAPAPTAAPALAPAPGRPIQPVPPLPHDADEDSFDRALPIELSIEYSLVSDYVWRGINFSEYRREGHERPNHQLSLGAEVDVADLTRGYDLGAVGASIWFQWYSGEQARNPGVCDHLQEVDYTLYWKNNFESIGTEAELGWIYYSFPRLSGDAESTYEIYAKLTFDDSAVFGTDKPVLSPYVYYGLDIDLTDEGSWLELGIEHEFNLADFEPFNDAAALRYLKITTSLSLGVDLRYLDTFALERGQEATRLGTMVYGLALDYDLTEALDTPKEYGSVSVGGFINFSDALREDILNDELYGGFRLGYTW